MIGLLCEHQSLTCLNESYKSMRFAVLLYVSIASSQHEFCIIYCFSAKPFFNVQWHYTSDFSSRRPCLYFCPSLPPSLPPRSVHPSTHLDEVRSGRPRRVEWSEGWSDSWSPVRQGETNYPTNESHSSSLHLSLLSSLSSSTPLREIQCTWMATPAEKTNTTKLTDLPHDFTLDVVLI